MSTRGRSVHGGLRCAALTLAVGAVPLAAAQQAPAVASSSAVVDTGSMPATAQHHAHDEAMPAVRAIAAPAATSDRPAPDRQDDAAPSAVSQMPHDGSSGVDHQDVKPAVHAMHGMTHDAMHHSVADNSNKPAASGVPAPAASGDIDMDMRAMQGGDAPAGARSPDYSDGVGYGSMKPHMDGDPAIGMLLFDQLETAHGYGKNAQSWEIEGSYGRDLDKVWVRTEGERSAGKIQDGDAEALWYHGIAAYWGSQFGLRHDFGAGPQRNWAAFGVEGLAPYFFDVQATGYVGSAGRTGARLRADYEILLTQRWMLQPELELNLYGRDDPTRRIGSGLSDASLGLRLRYEVRRQLAPYIGINWVQRVGKTADYARTDGEHAFDQQFVAGIRFWF